jgi:hypothetical protein
VNKVGQQQKVAKNVLVEEPKISSKTDSNVVRAIKKFSPKKDGNSPRKSLSPKKTK